MLYYYVPVYFKWFELVPGPEYERDWLGLFDPRVLITLDRLHKKYDTTYVNNWYWGGDNHFGGWRPGDCEIGAKFSQHKFGRAADPKFKNVAAEEIRQDILKHPYDPANEFITCIEADVNWLHFSVQNYDKSEKGILVIHP